MKKAHDGYFAKIFPQFEVATLSELAQNVAFNRNSRNSIDGDLCLPNMSMKKSMDKIQLASSTIRIITWTIVFQTSLTSMVPRHCSLPRDCCAKRCKYSAVRDGSNCIVPCWRARRKRRSMYQSVRRPPDGWLEMCWFCSVTRSSQKQRYRNAWIVLKRQCPFAKHMNEGGDACNVAMWNPFLNLTSPVTKVTALSSLETKHIPQQKRGDDSWWFINNLCNHWVIHQ